MFFNRERSIIGIKLCKSSAFYGLNSFPKTTSLLAPVTAGMLPIIFLSKAKENQANAIASNASLSMFIMSINYFFLF